jgi:6-phosphofructokinase
MKDRQQIKWMTLVAAGALAFGVAAPAFAEGTRTSYMVGWSSGDSSNDWYDANADATNTHVTFRDCTREFQASIRKSVTGPDPLYGTEWIDCKAYADAVYAGDVPAGN